MASVVGMNKINAKNITVVQVIRGNNALSTKLSPLKSIKSRHIFFFATCRYMSFTRQSPIMTLFQRYFEGFHLRFNIGTKLS